MRLMRGCLVFVAWTVAWRFVLPPLATDDSDLAAERWRAMGAGGCVHFMDESWLLTSPGKVRQRLSAARGCHSWQAVPANARLRHAQLTLRTPRLKKGTGTEERA